jgi:hypothetical protein
MSAGERLYSWEVDRLAELRREWRAAYLDYERTVVAGVPALRVTVYAPDPKQESDHFALRFLVSRNATMQLPAVPA